MSVIIEVEDRELWSPSLQVANLFRAQVTALEAFLALPSGLAESLPDTIEVNTTILTRFVAELLGHIRSSNSEALIEMSWACTKILVALLARATGEWPAATGRAQVLIEEARSIFAPMSS